MVNAISSLYNGGSEVKPPASAAIHGQSSCSVSGQQILHSPFLGHRHGSASVVKAIKTRSSAIAEGPRDASCQLKSCQLPRNSAGTTCTTSPEQIELIKLEDYSGTMCNKHVHLSVMRSSSFYCPMGVTNKQTTDRVVDILCIPTT